MMWFHLRIVAVIAALAIAPSSQAQTTNGGQAGTGGAAGHSLDVPDMSRSMSAPAPDLEAQPPMPPEPMNAPPVEEEKKDENTPHPADAPQPE